MKKPGRQTQSPDWPRKCNASAFADFCGVGSQAVKQWANKGMPIIDRSVRGSELVIDPVAAMPWVVSRNVGGGGERDRLSRAQAERTELDVAVRRGTLIERELVETMMLAMVADMAGRLDGLPGRMASELAGINDAAVVRARLLDECRAIRKSHAEYIGRYDVHEAPPSAFDDEGDESSTEEDSKPVGRRKSRPASGKRRTGAVEK